MKEKSSNLSMFSKLKHFTVLCVSIAALNGTADTLVNKNPGKEFIVFDSIHYRDKGDSAQYGMKPYTILYTHRIWPKNLLKISRRQPEPPPEAHIIELVKDISPDKSPVIYDIEHWPLDIRKAVPVVADDDISGASEKAVKTSMQKMIHIINCSKKANPALKYGYYGCVPLRDYWSPVKNDPEMLKQWKKANDYLKPLAEAVDVICPSLYTFYPDRKAWVKYAKANIAEAKRLSAGKPIYAYLWPKYHTSSNKKDKKRFIDGDFWRLQLETVYNSGIDGIIIWDSTRVVNDPKDSIWDPNRAWWQETVSFLKRIKNRKKNGKQGNML